MKILGVIEILSRDLSKGLTINQISKLLHKSYAATNMLVRGMISDEILNKLIVGNAILCTLNLRNELTRALLAVASVKKKQTDSSWKKKIDIELIDELKRRFTIECVFLQDDKLNIVCRNVLALQEFLNERKIRAAVFEAADFHVKKDLSRSYVIYGFERFWELIANA
ncbi:hypothetical protein DRJ17_03780 [Candidatus Woesearchaeota archaeon]|nr:MAG: hypothetical protein DRJ17_03780 [Candidatus Woesearchaeota archaeon]